MTMIPLQPEELSAFRWRHPLVSLDITLGTVIEGENVYDETLNGWIVYRQGVWYWTERTNQPENVGIVSQAGTLLKKAGTETAKASFAILMPIIVIGIIILLIQSGGLKWLKTK